MTLVLWTIVGLVVLSAALELLLRIADVADPPTFKADPRFGFVMHPDQSVSTRGHRFRINNLGLRGPDVGPKRERERRVVFVGDSLAYGGGRVHDPDLFVARIVETLAATRHEPVSSLNVAVPGWGVQNMTGFITAMGLFEADVVVWILSSHDLWRPRTSLHDFGFPEQRPRSRLVYVTRSWLRGSLAALRPRTTPRRRPLASPVSRNVEALATGLQVVRSAAVPAVVVAVPGASGYGRLAAEVPRFQAVAEAHGAVFADLDVAFAVAKKQQSRLFIDSVHLTADGHRVVAEAVLPLVAEAVGGATPDRRAALRR